MITLTNQVAYTLDIYSWAHRLLPDPQTDAWTEAERIDWTESVPEMTVTDGGVRRRLIVVADRRRIGASRTRSRSTICVDESAQMCS